MSLSHSPAREACKSVRLLSSLLSSLTLTEESEYSSDSKGFRTGGSLGFFFKYPDVYHRVSPHKATSEVRTGHNKPSPW